MSPYERAQLVYQQEYCPRSFAEDMELHLRNGYVFNTPDLFVMGRAVDHQAGYSEITNPAVQHVAHTAWLIYLMAGSMDRLERYLPYPLPYVGWERKNVLRFHAAPKIWNKLKAYDRIEIYPTVHPLLQGRRDAKATETTFATGADDSRR